MRSEIRALLKRSELEILKTITGERSGEEGDPKSYEGKLFSFLIRGEAVNSPFKRYYLNRKLENLCDRLNVSARTRRMRKDSSDVFIDVYPLDEDIKSADRTGHGTRRRIAVKGESKSKKIIN